MIMMYGGLQGLKIRGTWAENGGGSDVGEVCCLYYLYIMNEFKMYIRYLCMYVFSKPRKIRRALPFLSPKKRGGLTFPTSVRKPVIQDETLQSREKSQALLLTAFSTSRRRSLGPSPAWLLDSPTSPPLRPRPPSLPFLFSAAANFPFPFPSSPSSSLRFLLFLSSLARFSRSNPSAFRRARFSSSGLTTHGLSRTSFWNAVFSAQAAASSFVVRMMAEDKKPVSPYLLTSSWAQRARRGKVVMKSWKEGRKERVLGRVKPYISAPAASASPP